MSRWKGGKAIVQVGEAAPAFVLPNEMGEPVSLPGATPTVLVFYRGDW
jgi:peroxiredoxin